MNKKKKSKASTEILIDLVYIVYDLVNEVYKKHRDDCVSKCDCKRENYDKKNS